MEINPQPQPEPIDTQGSKEIRKNEASIGKGWLIAGALTETLLLLDAGIRSLGHTDGVTLKDAVILFPAAASLVYAIVNTAVKEISNGRKSPEDFIIYEATSKSWRNAHKD